MESIIPNSKFYVADTKIDFIKVTRNLVADKTHGHDKTSIWMRSLSDLAMVKALSIIYENCISY